MTLRRPETINAPACCWPGATPLFDDHSPHARKKLLVLLSDDSDPVTMAATPSPRLTGTCALSRLTLLPLSRRFSTADPIETRDASRLLVSPETVVLHSRGQCSRLDEVGSPASRSFHLTVRYDACSRLCTWSLSRPLSWRFLGVWAIVSLPHNSKKRC